MVSTIESRGFATLDLSAIRSSGAEQYGLLERSALDDALICIDVLDRAGIRAEWIVVDHYGIGREWEATLRPFCNRIAVIDDLANRAHDCDLLMDQNIVTEGEYRYSQLVPRSTIQLLGPRFALLDPMYRILRGSARRRFEIRAALIYFGGVDEENRTSSAIAAVSIARPDVAVHVVLPQMGRHRASLVAMTASNANVVLHQSLATLAHLLNEADIAIGAAGSASWERLCLGVPSIVVAVADNQRPTASALSRLDLAIEVAGTGTALSIEIAAAIDRLSDRQLLTQMSEAGMRIVDGLGASRVARSIIEMSSQERVGVENG
jgi:UDP-2,4-diacetamido-2,4,6-trideoxy-beta-L-altropyranose hydrolase